VSTDPQADRCRRPPEASPPTRACSVVRQQADRSGATSRPRGPPPKSASQVRRSGHLRGRLSGTKPRPPTRGVPRTSTRSRHVRQYGQGRRPPVVVAPATADLLSRRAVAGRGDDTTGPPRCWTARCPVCCSPRRYAHRDGGGSTPPPSTTSRTPLRPFAVPSLARGRRPLQAQPAPTAVAGPRPFPSPRRSPPLAKLLLERSDGPAPTTGQGVKVLVITGRRVLVSPSIRCASIGNRKLGAKQG